MSNLSLRQLSYFLALADHRHFGRAAEACAISQPALSMQIKELEARLGAPVFERRGHSLQLTPVGTKLAAHAEAVLQQMEQIETLSESARSGRIRKLRLGIIPTIGPYFLPKVIEKLRAYDGSIILNIRETMTSTLLEELDAGALDAAIVALPIDDDGLSQSPLFTEEFLLARPIWQQDEPIPDPSALSEMQLLLLEEGHCFRDQALEICNMRARSGRELLDASALSTLVQMVAAGLGVTLIPEMASEVETRSAHVALSRFPEPRPMREIGLIWRKTSPYANHFRELSAALSE